jgi:predicted esterase YcpF (UPF0227 family)
MKVKNQEQINTEKHYQMTLMSLKISEIYNIKLYKMSELDDPIFVQYMQSDDIAMAQASAVAYQHELNLNANPTTANAETQKLLTERFTEPHFIVPEFSNENAITIKRPNDEYIMAVRGTRPTNINDLAADAQILINDKNNIRVNSVEKLYNSFKAENPNSKLTLTGHSLGSWVAHQIANKYDEPFVGFNLPASPLGILTDNLDYNTTAEHKIYLTKNLDVISSLNKYTKFTDKVISLPQKQSTLPNWLGSHDIQNYLPDKKETLKPRILKTKRGKNTYYSTPNAEDVRRSQNSVGFVSSCLDNPTLEKCNRRINKKLI